ncbi:MAG: FtsX-like permease family protein [Longimicrobiales bacterium]
MARTSFALVMLTIASAAALLLGVVGIYGVTSYAVAQRSHELGLRMALGAQRGDVSRLVLRHTLVLAGVGAASGVALAIGLTRWLSALLYGVSPVDTLTFAAVTVAVAATALVASYLPARRAACTDPVTAFRAK